MRNHFGRSGAAATVMGIALAAPLSAQGVDVTVVGETAGDDVSLFLAEGNWSPPGVGVKPVVSLQTYIVTFDAGGDATGSTWSLTPAVGIRYGMDGGFVQGKVGYAIKGAGDDGATDFFGGAEDGVTTTGHVEWWGTGAVGLQGIASHNFGSDYLWSRARGTVRVIDAATSSLHAGLEASWQADLGTELVVGGVEQPNYSATTVGPVVKWATENVTAALGAGWKGIDADVAPEGEESTWYARVELVMVPRW